MNATHFFVFALLSSVLGGLLGYVCASMEFRRAYRSLRRFYERRVSFWYRESVNERQKRKVQPPNDPGAEADWWKNCE